MFRGKPGSVALISDATATGAGSTHQPVSHELTFQAYGATSAGAGSATLIVQVSDLSSPATGTDVDWLTLGTITLTLGTTRVSDGFASSARWRHVRGKVTAISGTDATVSLMMGG